MELIIGFLILIVLITLVAFKYVKTEKIKKNIIKNIMESDFPIIANYLHQRDISNSNLVSDMPFIYEFELNKKTYYFKYYPTQPDREPPVIPKQLDIKVQKFNKNSFLFF